MVKNKQGNVPIRACAGSVPSSACTNFLNFCLCVDGGGENRKGESQGSQWLRVIPDLS